MKKEEKNEENVNISDNFFGEDDDLVWINDCLKLILLLIIMKRWLRYGIIGNFLTYGIGFGFIAYLGKNFIDKGWIVWDIG